MKTINSIRIRTQSGLTLQVPVENCDDREAATIFIDNVPYHIERMPKALLCKEYKIDTEPDYDPQTDNANRCVMVAPFGQK
jgi:hypothetical protein